MRKRIIAIAILLLLAGFTGWLIIEASGPEVLPIGSPMPEIKYISAGGNCILTEDTTIETMVIYFSSECGHCKYELSQINNNIVKFKGIRIYLFTTGKDFFQKPVVKNWNKLYKTKNSCFGVVDKGDYENKFGSMVTPSIFIFDTSNKLIKKIHGEIKIEGLLKDLNI